MTSLKLLCLTFLVANCVAAETAKTHCGIRNIDGIDSNPKKVDNQAEFGEFPWMVGLTDARDGSIFCGGAIIAPKVIITGAVCISGQRRNTPNEIKIRAGEWDTESREERLPYQERTVMKFIRHPETLLSNKVLNDIALLVLNEDLVRDEHVGPICLPGNSTQFKSNDCYTMGWGVSKAPRSNPSSILKKIKLPIIDNQKCTDILRKKIPELGVFFTLDPSSICAGPGEGADTCSGDGGGPMVCTDPNNSNRYLLAGMVSWGTGQCGSFPSAYTNVSYFRDWVDQQMSELKLDVNPYMT